MTTIVGYNGTMWSDSQETRGYMMDNQECQKIHEIGGCLVGTSGNSIGASKFVEWFGKQLDFEIASDNFPYVLITPPEEIVDERFHCLVIYPDKTMYEYFGCKDVYKVTTPYTALGSGGIYAICALDAGATPEVAMEVAIKRDVFSGGEVQCRSVCETVELTEDSLESMSKEQLIKFIQTGEVDQEVVDNLNMEIPLEEETKMEYCFQQSDKCGNHLSISHDGLYINFGEGNYVDFTSVYDLETYGVDWYKCYADILGVKYAHNISLSKLIERMDNKVKEIVAQSKK